MYHPRRFRAKLVTSPRALIHQLCLLIHYSRENDVTNAPISLDTLLINYILGQSIALILSPINEKNL